MIKLAVFHETFMVATEGPLWRHCARCNFAHCLLLVTDLHRFKKVLKGNFHLYLQSAAASQGILVTSYGGLVSNKEELIRQNFDYIILDEGHKIRNPDAQITLAVKEFPTCHRIILSGQCISEIFGL